MKMNPPMAQLPALISDISWERPDFRPICTAARGTCNCELLRLFLRSTYIMNHPYLMHHISGTLHTFVRSYPLSGSGKTKIYGNIVDFSDEPYGSAVSSSDTVIKHRDDMPLIISVSDQFAYGSVSLSKSRYLIGPVRFETRIYISNVITPDELGLADT